ncbi:hypothetical protein [Aquimarina rubra]|uniref:Uncharacterized protein n=1 Tax=Aquimarina rubra TaxID=1920033 RepID=A0ABW5LDJ4_9FLAO
MKNLIYYPNFESSDLEWLKFSLLYLDSFSPIIPDTGIPFLSELYKKLQNETDLLKLQSPGYGAGERATRKAIDYVTKVLQNPHSYANELHSANIIRVWKNPEKQNYTLFDEKFVGQWRWFCEENDFVKDSKFGIDISKDLGQLYMTFLAQEVAYEKEASPITDNKKLDDLSIAIRTKDVTNDNKILVAKSIIEHQLPLDFSEIEIDKVIAIRNSADFKKKQSAFHSELDNAYTKLGKGIDPSEFSKSFNKTLKEWTGELTSLGIKTISYGLSTYVLLENIEASSVDYIRKVLEAGLILQGGKSLIKNINKNHERKYCRQYLTQLESL